jgi:outer membrane protein assembly factor BamB
MHKDGNLCFLTLSLLLLASFCAPLALVAQTKTAVTTYHYDNLRTGWNNHETKLTPRNVSGSSFARLASVTLDDLVNVQPLVVPNQQIGSGSHSRKFEVVYVATESNTIYAIDAATGKILLHRNFGTPVSNPLGCTITPNVGIDSTPVIDPATSTMYVIVYTNGSQGPVYRIHALGLTDLKDKVHPVVVTGSHQLTDGTQFNFNATYQRQRPGLLLANGNIYAGFGSFCDIAANLSRGWLLGWQTGSLTPLAANQVFDTQATSPDDFFLSSIWMSGFGIAADEPGNLFFVTGNSDPSGTTYDGVTNIQESVIEISRDLTRVLDLFTPDDWGYLDQEDADFGSGGVLLLPPQSGSTPHLAVAAGKIGNMFFMDRDDLGGYNPNQNNVLGTYYIGACWCGPSYFVDPSDSTARVVSSGGSVLAVWKLQTSPTPTLTDISSTTIPSGQTGGFFTSVSSDGNKHPIIWAVSRPYGNPPLLYLYAFDPENNDGTLVQLFTAKAGLWPVGGNSNTVPVVANGRVFVGSYQRLTIFGLKGGHHY